MRPSSVQRLLTIALFALVVTAFSYTQADPDLWGHVRFGEDIARDHAITRVDPYSFTSDRPWFNHEWLAELAMYYAYAAAGATGLVLLKVSALTIMMWAAVSMLVRPASADGLALVVGVLLVGTLPQAIHARPQLFSLALFAVLLRTLTSGWGRAGRDSPAHAVFMAAVLALWANLHGGWIVGAGTLAFWAFAGLFEPVPKRQRVWTAFAAACCLAASLLNPYGWGLWGFLFETVSFGRDSIADWQPVYRLGPAFVILWLALVTASWFAVMRMTRRDRLNRRAVALLVLFAIASFRVNRLVAFFAISLVILMGRWLVDLVGPPQSSVTTTPVGAPHSPWMPAAAAGLGVVLLAGLGVVTYRNAACIPIDAASYPDAESTEAITAADLRGRLLTTFGWGQYAIWHLAPRLLVSIDGRRETVYSDDVVDRQFRLVTDPSSRTETLHQLSPDYAWLPSGLALVPLLESDGWTRVFTGSRSVVLARQAGSSPLARQVERGGQRCFPGP